jgi:6-phosphogluconolactonase
MKFTKFGKALLISALSAGVVLGVSSCIQDYTVGYIYVTGTTTGQTGSNGIVSGYYIDHNNGKLNQIHGLPVASGGANPIRAVLLSGSRFMYVLNRGVNANGTADCSGTSGDTVCNSSNIEAFAVGGNGILTPQATYYTQGLNPFRMVTDSSGGYLMVLDHDAPSAAGCQAALGSSTTSCGDITVFKIDSTTGRLSLVTNTQGTSTLGSSLTYFPVPANPIDFLLTGSNMLTLSGTTTTVNSVFPYTYTSSTGQLSISQNTSQPLGIYKATGMAMAGSYLYVMANEAPSSDTTGATSMIIPYSVGSGGSLQAQNVGQIALDPSRSNPTWLIQDAQNKFIYVASQGNNTTGSIAGSGITGYTISSTSPFQLDFTSPATFGSGSGPQCILEDPSGQYIYTVNYNDSSITGSVMDTKAGLLKDMRVASTYKLDGPPTWAIMDGRTN